MKHYSATEARANFFKILDLSIRGEMVEVERNGVAIRLVPCPQKKSKKKTDYSRFIHSTADTADQWSWEWNPDSGVTPVELPKK